MKKFAPLLLCALSLCPPLAADDNGLAPSRYTNAAGRVFEGKLVSVTSDHLYLRTDKGGLLRVKRDQLAKDDAASLEKLLKNRPDLKDAALLSGEQASQDFRPLADVQGRVTIARIVRVTATGATIQTTDFKEFTLNFEQFCEEDRTFLQGEIGKTFNRSSSAKPSLGDKANSGVGFEEVNKAIGQPLFADDRLWDDTPEAAAGERLKWPRESATEQLVSYRLYPQFPDFKPEPIFKKSKDQQKKDGKDDKKKDPVPKEDEEETERFDPSKFKAVRPDYTLLGAKPYSCALYGKGGRVSNLSLVFTNSGDANAAEGFGIDHFKPGEKKDQKDLGTAIREDGDNIYNNLTNALGEPTLQKIGDGKTARTVRRWDWKGHAFLLTQEDRAYVALAIMPSADADTQGRMAAVKDDALRARLKLNVTKRPNGDVYLKNIPMVDQGPKGYCMPATFERVMRYMGMDADMYLIAMMGGTSAEGSDIAPMVKGVRSYLAQSGRESDNSRRLREAQFKFDVDNIAKYIDQGVPVLWPHFSTEAFNRAADRRMESRLKTRDWKDWKVRMEGIRKQADQFQTFPDNGHINVIIGYNRETGEFCFSDSWGEDYSERWMHADEGNYVGARFKEIEKAIERGEKKGDYELNKYNWKSPVTVLLLDI